MTASSRAPGTRLERGHEHPRTVRDDEGTNMLANHWACGASPAGGGVDPVVSPIVVVSAPVDLDHAAAVGLLRWCEAWLHRLDIGGALLGHVLVDVGHTRRVAPSGLAMLEQARAESGRRQVGVHLVGAGSLLAASSLQARRCL